MGWLSNYWWLKSYPYVIKSTTHSRDVIKMEPKLIWRLAGKKRIDAWQISNLFSKKAEALVLPDTFVGLPEDGVKRLAACTVVCGGVRWDSKRSYQRLYANTPIKRFTPVTAKHSCNINSADRIWLINVNNERLNKINIQYKIKRLTTSLTSFQV